MISSLVVFLVYVSILTIGRGVVCKEQGRLDRKTQEINERGQYLDHWITTSS
jgi:hypothetical protein